MTFGSKMSHPSKTRISALEKLKQSNAAKLELETRKMEERIRSLKEKMTKEKEERERLGGSRWTSGRIGPLTKSVQKSPGLKKNHAKGTVNKVPRKIKILTDEPVDSYIRRPQPIPENRINLCGQCERSVSEWICHECSEKYCDICFNQFHLKGALRKHTKTKVGAEAAQESKKQTNSHATTVRQENSILKSYGATVDITHSMENDDMNGPSLLSGSYDEEESANSFAQALQEWRNQNQESKISPTNHPVCTDTSCGTSNGSLTDQDDRKELTIKFNSSISYGDRLYLKKNRENHLEFLQSTGNINESDKKGRKEANSNDIRINNKGSDVQHEEKENNEPVDNFAPNYREMIQNITAIKSNPDIPSSFQENNLSSRRAVSVQEVSPGEFNIQDDQGTTCIVEECEDAATDQARPTSSRGAVTICELYSSNDSKQDLTKNLEQTTDLDTHNYVSPSITSKPFFLKQTGKVKLENQPERTVSAGRKKTSNRDEQRKIVLNKEKQSPRMSSKKSKDGKKSPSHQDIDINESSPVQRSTKSSKQLPLSRGKEKRESSLSSHRSPRPLSNKGSTKNKTRIPIRQAWKPKPTHKELSEFFLAGVDEGNENLLQYEDVYNERSSSTPITNLGRGCLSSTWNPVESYPQISPDSIDISSSMEIGISTPEKQDYQPVAEIKNSDDLRLTSHNFEQLKELPQSVVSKENEKNNSSNEEDELLELTALDEYGTGDQDDDDLATLNDLAWELESSTGGRLTRCEEDFHQDSDDDSIEDKDGGSGLSTPCTLERSATFGESIMDDFEEMERKFMEEEF